MTDRMAESGLGLTIGTRDQSRTKVQMNMQNWVYGVTGTDPQTILVEHAGWMEHRATGRAAADEVGGVPHAYLYLE